MDCRLHEAARNGNLAGARELLDQGHGVNKRDHDEYEETPLHCAVEINHVEMMRFLYDGGAGLEARDVEIVRFLVDRGADLEARNSEGDTPIMICFDFHIFEFLLSRGADAMTTNNTGGTLLHWILIHNFGQHWLNLWFNHIDGGLRTVLSMKDSHGCTPLHMARNVASARRLAEYGFDPSTSVVQSTWMCPSILFIRDDFGKTPLEESEEWRNEEKAKYLASFESLPLVDPATMKLSAGLDLFQRFLARRVYYTALCKIPTGHNVSLCIMAFLCPSDVMK